MNKNCRIELTDSLMDISTKLTEGNPGAINVLLQIIHKGSQIDPDDIMSNVGAGGLGVMLSLDTYAIYGSRIWMLYKDVCGQDITEMIAALRAVQLGIIPEYELQHAIDNYGEGLTENLLEKVQKRLPAFGKTKNGC